MVSGKEFRQSLRKASNISDTRQGANERMRTRVVPAFSVQSLQSRTIVQSPPKLNIFKPRTKNVTKSKFRQFYERGDLPISMEFDIYGLKIGWKVEIEQLDFHYYLPIFFDGLVEMENPYKFFSRQGIKDLLTYGSHKVCPVIPQLIMPMKNALNTKNVEIICNTLIVMQQLVKCGDKIGEALVPYYRQILPILNLFKQHNVNCGDEIDYAQRKKQNVGDLINETLELLEQYGGEDAFINIKYLIPTYESCVVN